MKLHCRILFALVLAAGGSLARGDEIVIGTTLPLSGPLAGFGAYQKWGYESAVREWNDRGGILVDGRKLPVRLVVRDDRTDPGVSAGNIETLLSRDGAVALLGSCTPALVNAGALVAERRRVPLVAGCDPLQAFRAAHRWKYAWAIFFDESDLASAPFRMLADLHLETNRTIAIMTENGPDGAVVGGRLWPEYAARAGFNVLQISSFPIDTQQFTTMIAQAKAGGADIILADAMVPQAVALRKQIAAAGYLPRLLVIEKGAEPEAFARAAGKLADGVLVGGYWDPSFPYPGAAELARRFEDETHQSQSQHIADSHAAAQVLLAAIEAAGSLDREKINAAIARTSLDTVVGRVKFDETHASAIPITVMQWQAGRAVVVWPKNRATGTLIFPLPDQK